ncbi:MAG: hypothetical protein MUC63_00135 [Planctomycetes bacterium]|jgi:hypothetical protein|nr:hypothetical protein [Planctomycetota bacterium]
MSPIAARLALPVLVLLAFPSAASAKPALEKLPGAIGALFAEAVAVPAPEAAGRTPAAGLLEGAADSAPTLVPARAEPSPRDPYFQSEILELRVTPSLTTFFCNPYCLQGRSPGAPRAFSLNAEELPEINVGLMGRLHDQVRIGLFSTLSGLVFRSDFPFPDRLRELKTHRVALLLALTPAPGFALGAGGGADVVEDPRAYEFEVLVEARMRF